jgi:C-terminal processing protease CtpA/Prc
VNQEREAALRSFRQQYVERGAVMIWKMPAFFAEDAEIDRLFGIARKHAGLVLDLRGNSGGRVDTLTRMIGNLFDHDVTVATRAARADQKKIVAQERAGVTPDETTLPSAQDLAAGRDPVLSHAVHLAGADLDPVAAGKLFPFEWPVR